MSNLRSSWRDASGGPASLFRSLLVRNFRLYLVGLLVKTLGVWMMFTAQSWLVLGLSGDSPAALGIVTALQFTPTLLLTLVSGRLADRYDKRILIFVSSCGWIGAAAGMSVLVLAGGAQLWHVYVFATMFGAANAVEQPVRLSFVSDIVEPRELPNALGLSSAAFNTSRLVGPALAGLGIAALGIGPIFLISAAAAIAPLHALARMRVAEFHREDAVPADDRDGARVADGLRYVWRRPDLLMPMVLTAVIGLAAFNTQVTFAALAKTGFHTGSAAFGLFTTALAAGALIGALAGGARRSRPSAYAVLGGGFAVGLFNIFVGVSHVFWLALVLLVPTGFCMTVFTQATNLRVQLGTDSAYRSRVISLWLFLLAGTNPIAAPVVGWIGERYGAGTSIWLGGAISLAASGVGLAWQLRHTRSRLRLRLHPRFRIQVVASERA